MLLEALLWNESRRSEYDDDTSALPKPLPRYWLRKRCCCCCCCWCVGEQVEEEIARFVAVVKLCATGVPTALVLLLLLLPPPTWVVVVGAGKKEL